MSNIIDVLVVHDAARILQDHAAQSYPANSANKSGQINQSNSSAGDNWVPLKNGGRSYVFLVGPWNNVAQAGNVRAQEGGSELRVNVNVGDVIRYRMRHLPLRRDYEAFIEQVDICAGDECLTHPVLQQRASNSTTLDTSVATLNQVMPIPITDCCWESTMTQSGNVALSMKFRIYDDRASLRGSFSFNPWLFVQA